MTKLRTDWANKMQTFLGYAVVEDEEGLKAFNFCIKCIIQSEKAKWKKKQLRKSGSIGDI